MSLIKKIRIKNFKSLEDVEIDMKQLNFLFGPNSSGKSSFLKAMMFLSKNMLPLNTGKTIYKISDEVDLGSYKDIVTNNDESKRIIFEIDFEGEYEFLKFEAFSKMGFDYKYKGILILPEYKSLFNFFDDVKYPIQSVRTMSFDEAIESEKEIDNSDNFNYKDYLNEQDYPIENCKINLTVSIEFSNIEPNYNFTRMGIIDNVKKSSYKFVRKDKRPNDEDGESGMISEEQFAFLNNLNLSEKLGYHYISTDSKAILSDSKISPKFTLSDIFDLYEDNASFYTNKKEFEIFYYESIRFIYLSHRLVPDILKSLLDLKHLPTTRVIPKKYYSLEKGGFNPRDYYGLLKVLSEEFYPAEFSGSNVNHEIKNKSYEEILKIIIEYPLIDTEDSFMNLKIGNFLRSCYFNINNNIKKLGFNHFYEIEQIDDIGRIYLRGKDKMKMYMSNSSSGFIQVFPIVACCVLTKINHSKSDLDEWNSIQHKKNEFPNNYYKSELDKDFHSLFIEQPELHLHPKLQSQLAELFADTIKNANIFSSLFIETHSEHLIRKIQVLIAKGELDREKVGVWYFDNNEGITMIKEMKLDENGLFKEDWPKGFFDDSVNLTMELFEAIRKRKN